MTNRHAERGARASAADRLLFIDGLRGIAAMMVVLYHLVGRTPAEWLTARGHLGVTIFFVLSGFVIAKVIGATPVSWGFLGRFAARRSIRLDIPYWASIVVALVLAYLATRIGFPKEFPSLAQLLAHLVYLQDILGYEQMSQAYWTLCLEVQFYLFLVLLLWIGRQQVGSVAFQTLFGILLGLSLLEQAAVLDLFPERILFLSNWFCFALGALTYWTIAGRACVHYMLGAYVATLGAMLLSVEDWFLVAPLTAALLYVAVRLNRMGVWLSGAVPQFLGRISYSLYLFHPFFGWYAQSVALQFVDTWVALAVGIFASVASAWVTYQLIERPSIRWSRLVPLKTRAEPADPVPVPERAETAA